VDQAVILHCTDQLNGTLSVAQVIQAGEVVRLFFGLVTAQTGGNNVFNLQFLQGYPVNLIEGV
jgi:hypothetical protein